MAEATEVSRQDPSYITYMLTPDMCEWFFLVGNKELCEPERIGVVKKNLLAQSEPLRAEMLSRQIDNKEDIVVTDTYPDTFKNLLRFVYGYDITDILTFEEADNLLYVAEKYQVVQLKARLSLRLINLLDTDNICSLLNNPTCYTVLELDSAIRDILQFETDKVLASPQFVELSCDNLIKVLEQDMMNIPEVEVWKAAIRWARQRTNSDEGGELRRELERPAKHLRICTIDDGSFFKEVASKDILTMDELALVCVTKAKGVKQPGLVSFSNEIECRKKPTMINFDRHTHYKETEKGVLEIFVKSKPVELLPWTFRQIGCPRNNLFLPLCILGSINVIKKNSINDLDVINFSQALRYDSEFSVPLTKGGRNIVLQPQCTYIFIVQLNSRFVTYNSENSNDDTYDNNHLRIKACSFLNNNNIPIRTLRYRVMT